MPKIVHPYGGIVSWRYNHPRYTDEQVKQIQARSAELMAKHGEVVNRLPKWDASCHRKGEKTRYRFVMLDHGPMLADLGVSVFKFLVKAESGRHHWVSFETFVTGWLWTKRDNHKTKKTREKWAREQAKSKAIREAARNLPMKGLAGVLEEYQPQFMKYWPYGPGMFYPNRMCRKLRLDQLYLHDQFYSDEKVDGDHGCQLTKDALRFKILEDVARAMHYLIVYHADGYGWQRNEAFAMARVFTSGDGGWVKPIPKNWARLTRKRLRKDIMGKRGMAYLTYDQRKNGKDVKVIERVINKAIRDKEGQHKQTFYHIRTPGLSELGLPELVAIYFIVVETFENLC